MTGDSLSFRLEPHAAPVIASERAAILAKPGFGRFFTDHMAVIRYNAADGWHDAHVQARTELRLDPAAAVLHYAQEIFEGLKAYNLADGGTALFRPEANARRFRDSAERLAMAQLPEELFVESIRRLVQADRDWIPDMEGGSLYLRPFMFASEAFLGVKPASEYLYLVIASPVGPYFKNDGKGVTTVSKRPSKPALASRCSAKGLAVEVATARGTPAAIR